MGRSNSLALSSFATFVIACGGGAGPVPSLSSLNLDLCHENPEVLALTWSEQAEQRDNFGLMTDIYSPRPTDLPSDYSAVSEIAGPLILWEQLPESAIREALQEMERRAPNAYARLCYAALHDG